MRLTGTYRCHVRGLYMFSVSIFKGFDDGERFGGVITRAGEYFGETWSGYGNEVNDQGSVTVVLGCGEGERVWVESVCGEGNHVTGQAAVLRVFRGLAECIFNHCECKLLR